MNTLEIDAERFRTDPVYHGQIVLALNTNYGKLTTDRAPNIAIVGGHTIKLSKPLTDDGMIEAGTEVTFGYEPPRIVEIVADPRMVEIYRDLDSVLYGPKPTKSSKNENKFAPPKPNQRKRRKRERRNRRK